MSFVRELSKARTMVVYLFLKVFLTSLLLTRTSLKTLTRFLKKECTDKPKKNYHLNYTRMKKLWKNFWLHGPIHFIRLYQTSLRSNYCSREKSKEQPRYHKSKLKNWLLIMSSKNSQEERRTVNTKEHSHQLLTISVIKEDAHCHQDSIANLVQLMVMPLVFSSKTVWQDCVQQFNKSLTNHTNGELVVFHFYHWSDHSQRVDSREQI